MVILPEYPYRVENGHKIVELTKDNLTVKLKPETVQYLKQLVQNDESLRQTVQTLLSWANELVIPVSQIVTVSTEVIAAPPGYPESLGLTVKSRHHGGFYLHEIRGLSPDNAMKLTSEIKKLIVPEF